MCKRSQFLRSPAACYTRSKNALALLACIAGLSQDRSSTALADINPRVLLDEQKRIELIERIAPSVVTIHSSDGRGGGSGVLIDADGYGLSNYHVLAKFLRGGSSGFGGLNNGERYKLTVLGVDPTGDVAMFRLEGRDEFPFAVLGDSDAVRVGDTAIAMGNPFSLSEDESPTVTLGIVTGTHRYQWGVKGNLTYSDCIQTDASINPGNSGGPLFNSKGEVIGINGRISVNTRGRFNVGFGYAVSSNQIKRFMPALRAGLLARHGTIQATVAESSAGVLFDEVARAMSAHLTGIRYGDRLVSVDRVPITSPNHFVSVMGTYPADWRVLMEIQRGQEKTETFVRLDPINPSLSEPFKVNRTVSLWEIRRVIRQHQEAMIAGSGSRRPRMFNWTVIREHILSPGGEPEEPTRYDASVEYHGPARMQQCYEDGDNGVTIEFDETRATKRAHGSDLEHELATDETMVLCARYIMHRLILNPARGSELKRVTHGGGNALRGTSELVEVLEWPVADNAVAALWFDTRTHYVVRIEVYDIPSRIVATIDISDYRNVGGVQRPGLLEVQCQGYTYRDRLVDWEVIR